jgi:hypothetical protein
VNDDLLTGNLFGKNICKISALHFEDKILPGEKVVTLDGDAVSSLTSDGEKLYYYKLNDKHFYSYDEKTKTETE